MEHKPSSHSVDPVLANRSVQGWSNFMRVTSYASAAIAVVLILMAIFLV